MSDNYIHSSVNRSKIGTGNSLGVDSLDIKIIRALLDNSDSSSSKMTKKLDIPLSTLRRRKARLEGLVLKKKYELDAHNLGWRTAEILMLIGNGKADHMAQELIEKFDNVISTSIRINTASNVAAYVGFRNSDELHELMEKIRTMPDVGNIEWSEIVREVGNKGSRLAHLVFKSAAE